MAGATTLTVDSVIPQLGDGALPGNAKHVTATGYASESSEPAESTDSPNSDDASSEGDLEGADSELEGDVEGDSDLDRAQGLHKLHGKREKHPGDASEGDSEGDFEGAGPGPGSEAAAAGGLLTAKKAAGLAQKMERIMKAAARAQEKGKTDAATLVLSASQSSAKRQADTAAADAAAREAKRMRKMLKTRGRQTVPRAGTDPAHDAAERVLSRIATSGVVRLFNAVTKAQAAQKEALLTGSKAKVSLSKADFFQQLKAGGSTKGGAAAATKAASTQQDDSTWEVLKEGYTGLQGGSKMKDWDATAHDEGDSEGDAGVSDLSDAEESG